MSKAIEAKLVGKAIIEAKLVGKARGGNVSEQSYRGKVSGQS